MKLLSRLAACLLALTLTACTAAELAEDLRREGCPVGLATIYRQLEKLDAPVRAILRAGLAQAKFMDVPLPAAVNESVKLAKAFGKTSAAGMVNAMLRRTAALDPKPEHWPDLEERLRTYYCLSQPIAALFAAQYPQDAEAMAAAFYQRRPTAIRVNPLFS